MRGLAQKKRAGGWIQRRMKLYDCMFCVATAGGVNRAAQCRTWKFTTNNFEVIPAIIPSRT